MLFVEPPTKLKAKKLFSIFLKSANICFFMTKLERTVRKYRNITYLLSLLLSSRQCLLNSYCNGKKNDIHIQNSYKIQAKGDNMYTNTYNVYWSTSLRIRFLFRLLIISFSATSIKAHNFHVLFARLIFLENCIVFSAFSTIFAFGFYFCLRFVCWASSNITMHAATYSMINDAVWKLFAIPSRYVSYHIHAHPTFFIIFALYTFCRTKICFFWYSIKKICYVFATIMSLLFFVFYLLRIIESQQQKKNTKTIYVNKICKTFLLLFLLKVKLPKIEKGKKRKV